MTFKTKIRIWRTISVPLEGRTLIGSYAIRDGPVEVRSLKGERKTLTSERVQHVNRIKGLLFAQGISDYQPLRRNRHQRLDELKTGDARPLPPHVKAQISRELDRLELLLEQIKAVETERDALISAVKPEGHCHVRPVS